MKHFTLSELTGSLTAEACSIANRPPAEAEASLIVLAERVLDPLREAWGSPLYVTSGYRSAALNRKVGGVATSYHLRGMAADITAKSVFYNTALYTEIRILHQEGRLPLTECYLSRQGTYIHLAYDPKNINPQPFFTK
ncbi:MAG: peptidase M15 [Bacteroidaceae bacterium]|nr:peptidase M15 [Bacteroidaceae bacterium]